MKRPLYARFGWFLRDYARRVWNNSGEDNIFFLAGGISFNLLLAAIPFFLLIATGLALAFGQSVTTSSLEITQLLDTLLPPMPGKTQTTIADLIAQIIRSKTSLTFYSAIGFIWFSTRLFGSLRSVLAQIFDIENDRGIIDGKIFDIKITIISTLLLLAYTALSAYLAFATTRGITILGNLGLRQDVMGTLEYTIGRALAFAFIALMFFALYKYLPKRKIRWKTAFVASIFTSTLFELARNLFAYYVSSFNPGSFYTGTLAALVVMVVWTYYGALIFILGGEVAQVYELRRMRRVQRETFEVE